MSQPYQVLARKYRPSNFHELVGQTHVSNALINAIDNNRLHHAYLFTGTRGVGKTTIARILAKCLNCDKGISSTPCGVCDNCQMIDAGRFIDLIEIDAASRTKVEDTRDLLDNVPYAPTQGRYKVYLIDEVHMLSTHSFNALLKTLEEPPEHVKFLLATTDPQKLPITIISRCLQFVLRPLSQELLSEHLKNILTKENIAFENSALWQLAHSAKGSVRDSLSLTDQAIAFSQGELTEQVINDMLGLISGTDLLQLLAHLYNNDRIKVAEQIEQMRQQMVDANSVFDELAEILHKIALYQILPTIELNINPQQKTAIQQLAQLISAESLQLYYEIVLKSRENVAIATTPMQALEMCLLRMLAFRPLANDEVLVSENKVIEKQEEILQKTILEPQEITEISDNETEIIEENFLENEEIYPNENEIIEEEIENNFIEEIQTETEKTITEQTPQNEIISPTELFFTQYDEYEEDYELDEECELEEDYSDYYQEENYENYEDFEATDNNSNSHLTHNHDINHHNISAIKNNSDVNSLVSDNYGNDSIAQSDIINKDIDDPRQLLHCPPQELTGEWTADKWDYWIQTAREEKLLDADELAFARQGIMTGNCDGDSVFLTNFHSDKFQTTFDNLSKQLISHFSNANYQMQPFENKEQFADLPQNRQQQRQILAEKTAIEKLSQTPVMLKLQELGDMTIRKVKLYS